jgi:hypothetical protein
MASKDVLLSAQLERISKVAGQIIGQLSAHITPDNSANAVRSLLQSFIAETKQLEHTVGQMAVNGKDPVARELHEIIQREVSNLQEYWDSIINRPSNGNRIGNGKSNYPDY